MAEQFSAWGPEASGPRLAQLDAAKLDLANMQALHTAGQTMMIPSQIAAHEASANFHNVEAAGKLDALAANRRWQAGIDAMDTKGMNTAQYLSRVGIMGIQAGAPEAGRKVVNTASELQLRESTMSLNDARAAEQEALAFKHKAEQIGGLANTVIDQPSLDRALLIAKQNGMDISRIPSVYSDQTAPYFKQLADSSISAAKQADLQLKSIDEQRKQQMTQSRLQTESVRRELIKAEEALAGARRENLEKQGGKKGAAAASPTKGEIDQAKKIIREAQIDLPDEEMGTRAFEVAARGKALAKNNPGLDTAQGMRRALAEYQQQGGFKQEEQGPVGRFFGTTPQTHATRGGQGPLTAMPLPKNPADMKPDTYYITPQGPLKWVKQGGKYGFLKE